MKEKICEGCGCKRPLFAKKMCRYCWGKNYAKPYRYKKKPTGEKELFLKIWDARERICVKCGDNLGQEPLAQYFSHIKSKGSRPDLRLNPDNIELLCFDCHYEAEFKGSKK